ncbi:MAG: hypothetical protein Q8O53_02540 [Candidatus Moranbacteria bacterium]|nr:hypothetical protein [Candidatus Moranbacteria bacterium]
MKRGVKKSGKSEKSYSADHVSVMLEDVRDMMMAFGEGQDVLSEKVDVLSDKVDRMQDDITDIKYTLSEKVERSEFQKLEKRMIKVERAVFVKKA